MKAGYMGLLVGVALLAAAVAFVVCKRYSEPKPLPTRIIATGEDPRILVQKWPSVDLEIPLTARLEYDPEGRCLFLAEPVGSMVRFATPVWPAGTHAIREKGKRGVMVPGTGKILEGDILAGSGGHISLLPHLLERRAEIEIPDRCVAVSSFLFGEVGRPGAGTEDPGAR